ncbi:MAG: substrate-binding periplasmic protein [Aestuariibacter sp.]
MRVFAKVWTLIFCICWCIGSTFTVAAKSYKVLLYAPNNPPYVILDDPDNQGIFMDTFAAISKLTKDQFEFVHQPIARGLFEFDEGRIDIEPGVNPNWRKHLKVIGLYSEPYALSEEVIVFAPGHKKEVTGPSDLLDEIVGIARGFSYPRFDAAFSTDAIIRVNNVSQTHLMEQLLKSRFKQIFVGLNTIRYFQATRPEYQVLEIGNVVDEQQVMMRVHPQNAELMPRLNQAIAQLKASGEVTRIYDKYR